MINLSQVKNAYGKNVGDTVLYKDFPLDHACEICFYGSVWQGYTPINSAPYLLKDVVDFDESCSQYEQIYFDENPREKELEGFIYTIHKVIFLYRLKRGMMNPLFERPSSYYIFDIMLEYKIFHASFINGEVLTRKEFENVSIES